MKKLCFKMEVNEIYDNPPPDDPSHLDFFPPTRVERKLVSELLDGEIKDTVFVVGDIKYPIENTCDENDIEKIEEIKKRYEKCLK